MAIGDVTVRDGAARTRTLSRLFPVEVDRLGAEDVTEKLTENVGAESVRAGRVGTKMMPAGGQHQFGAACGAHRRHGWTIDIDHQGASALPCFV